MTYLLCINLATSYPLITTNMATSVKKSRDWYSRCSAGAWIQLT